MANSKSRRFLGYNRAFNRAVVKIGGFTLFYGAPNEESAPKWRGPACVLGPDETEVTVRYQGRTFKVARYCVRRRVGEKDAESNAGLRPLNRIAKGKISLCWTPTLETAPDAAERIWSRKRKG